MTRSIALLAATILLASLTGGCGSLVLTHTPMADSPQIVGTVALVVNNARPKDIGGENEHWVGKVRGSYGIPSKVEAENSLVAAMKETIADALANAGYQVADGAASQVVVDITQFNMDGFMGYRITAACDVKLVSGGTATFQSNIAQDHAFANMMRNDMALGYRTMLDKIAVDAQSIFTSSEFQAAVK